MPRTWQFLRIATFAVACAALTWSPAAARTPRRGDDLLQTVRDALDPHRPPRPTDRCLTPLVEEVQRRWNDLDPEVRVEIDQILHPHLDGGSTYVSPLGYFSLSYVTAGPDSVPDEDINPADGVPDFVERCATYADRAWTTEIDSLGFTAPRLPADGTYDIDFMGLPAYHYGYTEVVDGTTHMVLHHNFVQGIGWPGPNDDPDGTQAGRAKVTIAHEFKHASQYATSDWTEGPSWAELDAVWMEDIVYPQVNEYRYWVAAGTHSQLDQPWTSLLVSDSTGYEDCLWEHYMSGMWGAAVVRDYWTRRAQNVTETALTSYQETLVTRGSDWRRAYAGYLEWCWFTGARAIPGFAFPDAAELYRMELMEYAISSYPCTRTGTVQPLASNPRRYNQGNAVGSPRILFDGDDSSAGLVLSVIGKRNDGSFWIDEPPLDAGNVCNYLVAEPWSDFQYVGILVTNGDPWGPPAAYQLDILDEAPVGVATSPPRASVPRLSAQPNPARGAVTLTLDLPRASAGPLRILDVRGRTVRTLALAPSAAGRRSVVVWDARDDGGRAVPAGVYWAEMDAGASRLARRITLLR
ncbi:MAG: MXAN_6640 family putative metalloprotease [bacterium]